MKFCDEKIQKCLMNGGKIKRISSNKDWSYRPIVLDGELLKFADNGDDYIITKRDLTADDWDIVKPKYNWDKIIKDKVLCVFSDYEDFKNSTLLTLIAKDEEFYYAENRTIWEYCKPFNPNDYNIGIDLKEYEK